MKKTLIATLAVIIGLGMSSVSEAKIFGKAKATEFPATFKVAVVDIPVLVSKSAQVLSLKQEQEQKIKELQTWLNTVKADVAKQQTQEGKEKLIKKYDAEFANKQESIKRNYAKKLQAIDKSISETIAKQATALGYNMVFAKGTVLFGGDDITADVARYVK